MRDRLADGQVAVQAGGLEHDPDPRAQRLRPRPGVHAEHGDPAARALAEALEDLDGRRLARAVGPEQSEDLAAADRERDPADGGVVAVVLAEFLDLDGCLCGHGPIMATFIASPCAAPASTSGRTRRGCWWPSPAPGGLAEVRAAARLHPHRAQPRRSWARSPRRRSTPSRRSSPSSARPRTSTAASACAWSPRPRSAAPPTARSSSAALRERAGVEAEVLSGEEEARLAFHGAARTLDPPPGGTLAVVDVGGGSTEIAVGTLADGVHLGAVVPGRLELAPRRVRRRPAERDRSGAYARAGARGLRRRRDPRRPPTPSPWAGARRRCRSSSARSSTRPALERALGVLAGATAREVARLHGLAHERTQLLPAGILVLDAAAQALGGRPLRIGRGGLREGVVLELAAS